MAKREKFNEEELAAATEKYFESKGWETYPEVVIPNFGGRADIIGTKQNLSMVAECKVSFSYPVLEQLTRWHHEMQQYINSKYADESTKGIPHLLYAVVGGGTVTDLKREILESHRIGLIFVTVQRNIGSYSSRIRKPGFDGLGYGWIGDDKWRFDEYVYPKIQYGSRKTAHRIIEHLNPDMRCGTAGASGKTGGYMTPFRRTINKAKSIIDRGGEWHIQHIIDEINTNLGGHHYSSDQQAKSSIGGFLIEFGHAEKINEGQSIYRAITQPAPNHP